MVPHRRGVGELLTLPVAGVAHLVTLELPTHLNAL